MNMPLIALFGILAVIAIIAFSYPSFEERTRTDEDDKKPPMDKRKFGFVWWIIILLAVLAGAWVWKTKIHFPVVFSTVYPIAADAQDIWPQIGQTVKVKIYPDCWSGWVNLPPNVKTVVDAPGYIEYLFLRGERLSFKNKSVKPVNAPSCSFRIRGTVGEITLTVAPVVAIQ